MVRSHERTSRPFRVLIAAAGLLLLLLRPSAGDAGAPLPPVPEAPELAWNRQPFFATLALWNLDDLLFPASSRGPVPDPTLRGESASAPELYRKASAAMDVADRSKGDPRLYDEAARAFLLVRAAAKNGETGFQALRMAARSYFLAGRWVEADGVARKLIERSGGGEAARPWFLLRGEALYRRGNLLSARECFRRAASGKWDAETSRRIALRIADISLQMGNVAFAEPAFRKVLGDPGMRLRYPFEALRHGEALLAAGRTAEALALFREILSTETPALVRSAAALGEGDALLMTGNVEGARYAWGQAPGHGDFPQTRHWIRLRKADLDFVSGRRAQAASAYADLAGCPDPAVVREARYKRILTLFLLAEHAAAARESQDWLFRYAGTPGEAAIRKIAARAGSGAVRAAGKDDPASRWPALTAYLYAFGRTDELKGLMGDIGKEWEEARLWDGASSLYAAAGDAGRSDLMRRVARAEKAYYAGDDPGALAALRYDGPSKEVSPAVLWLAAKIHFRQGRYGEASAALSRLESAPGVAGEAGMPPARELAAFADALQGKWPRVRERLANDPLPARSPGLALVRRMAGPDDAPRDNTAAAARPVPPSGDLYAEIARVRERARRALGEQP